jgi:hypothetical protein
MDFGTAKELMEKIMSANAILVALSHDIDKLSEPERTDIMRGLGSTMWELHDRLVRPIGLQHPSLDPFSTPEA